MSAQLQPYPHIGQSTLQGSQGRSAGGQSTWGSGPEAGPHHGNQSLRSDLLLVKLLLFAAGHTKFHFVLGIL